KTLNPQEDDEYESESRDTFDEFDYKEEFNELEEENINKNSTLYLTNIEEVPTKRDDKKKEKPIKEVKEEMSSTESGQVGKKAYCQEPATYAVVEGTTRGMYIHVHVGLGVKR
ncbi:36570_t:CDS:2, partial [Gigaspora margarita]